MHTKTDVLGINGRVLMLPIMVTSSVWNTRTKTNVQGEGNMRIAYATRIPIRGFGENCSSTVSFLDGIFSARVPASHEGKKEARGKRAREREKEDV